MLAIVITRRIQPGLERLQNATLREVRVEDLTLGARSLFTRASLFWHGRALTRSAQATRRRW